MIEEQEPEVETAAFYSWDFFDYMTEEGYPGVVDHVVDCEWVNSILPREHLFLTENNFLIDNYYKAISRPVRCECTSCRVILLKVDKWRE